MLSGLKADDSDARFEGENCVARKGSPEMGGGGSEAVIWKESCGGGGGRDAAGDNLSVYIGSNYDMKKY